MSEIGDKTILVKEHTFTIRYTDIEDKEDVAARAIALVITSFINDFSIEKIEQAAMRGVNKSVRFLK